MPNGMLIPEDIGTMYLYVKVTRYLNLKSVMVGGD